MMSEKHILKRDGQRDMAVSGRMIAEASSFREGSMKWTELRLYRTDTGKYVIARDRLTKLQSRGEKNVHEAAVCPTAEDVLEWLEKSGSVADQPKRLGPLGKDLLEKAAAEDQDLEKILHAASEGELSVRLLRPEDAERVRAFLVELSGHPVHVGHVRAFPGPPDNYWVTAAIPMGKHISFIEDAARWIGALSVELEIPIWCEISNTRGVFLDGDDRLKVDYLLERGSFQRLPIRPS